MNTDDTEYLANLSQQGYQLLKEGLHDQARERFNTILSIDPDNSYALVGMGDLERKLRRFREAITHYSRCLEETPDNNYALFGLAECYRGMRQYHRATAVWERYLEHDDRNVTILTRVADAYRKAKERERSRELYERVLELEPDNPYALIGLGHLHYDFREFDAARQRWQRMYEISGRDVDIRVLTSLGNCHRKLNTYAEGVPYFEEALERDPQNFYALYGLADCYRGLRQSRDSLRFWLQLLELDPHNKVILTRTGDAYRALGELDTARGYYQRALEEGVDVYAMLGLAIIHRQQNDASAARRILEELLERDAGNPRAYVELADCYLALGDRAAAIAVLRRHAEGARRPARSVQRKLEELTGAS